MRVLFENKTQKLLLIRISLFLENEKKDIAFIVK